MKHNNHTLDTPVLNFYKGHSLQMSWTFRDAVEGVNIMGGIGSGKSSGSGRTLALALLEKNCGGLVLTVKPTEIDDWKEYCRLTSRLDDLIIVQPGKEYQNYFNFLQYVSTDQENHKSYTQNVVEVLQTVINASEEKSSGKKDDPFWESSLTMLLSNSISLCNLAYGSTSVQRLYDIAMSVPKKDEAHVENPKPGSFVDAHQIAKTKVTVQIKQFLGSLTEDQLAEMSSSELKDAAINEALPDAKSLKSVDQFFKSYRNLSEKTRSIVDFSFSSFLFELLQEPMFSLFCKHSSTFTPEDSLNGKIIIINLPVKVYQTAGRNIQLLFKYLWQQAMERRNIEENDRFTFLWADEAQNFIHSYDAAFQATARSSRVITVYLSQNLPNYHANMGGMKSEYHVKSFLGTLATKIFHANADIETNNYASTLIGDGYRKDVTKNFTVSGNFSSGESSSMRLQRLVRPEEFMTIRTGSIRNDYAVDAYMLVQGKPFNNKSHFQKVTFSQK